MAVTKENNVYELLETYPNLEEVLESHGLTCVGCPGAAMESLEQAAEGHGIDLQKLLDDINKELESK